MEILLTIDNETCDMDFLDRMRLAHKIEELVETDENLKADVGGALSAATFAPDISRTGYSARSGLTRRLEAHRNEFRAIIWRSIRNGRRPTTQTLST